MKPKQNKLFEIVKTKNIKLYDIDNVVFNKFKHLPRITISMKEINDYVVNLHFFYFDPKHTFLLFPSFQPIPFFYTNPPPSLYL